MGVFTQHLNSKHYQCNIENLSIIKYRLHMFLDLGAGFTRPDKTTTYAFRSVNRVSSYNYLSLTMSKRI